MAWGENSKEFSSGDYRIGRDPECEIWINHPQVSRRHATIRGGDTWVFADEGSSNGTFHLGERVQSLQIAGTLTLHLGDPVSGPVLTLTAAAPQPSQPVAVTSAAARTRIILGRDPSCHLTVDDPLASRRHALIEWRPDPVLRDLESLNGTFLNGAPIDQRPLAVGDLVTIGNHDYRFDGSTLTEQRQRKELDGLNVRGIDVIIPPAKKLLAGVEFDAPRGSLIAVIGPSGAGKSTLSGVVTGNITPASGVVLFNGMDVHRQSGLLRSRIGFVPQADVVHGPLTVQQAVMFAARLRLPDDTSHEERLTRVSAVLSELGLSEHVNTRVDRLSGGQRKRVSVALELLTEPALLVLDEPTSGLDPALDRHLMSTLRALADRDRSVLVVTHSVSHLSECDQILLLAPGGKTAYLGAPDQLLSTLGAANWSAAFAMVADDPEAAYQRHLSSAPQLTDAPEPKADESDTRPVRRSTWGQGRTVAARQLRLIAADRGYAVFLGLMPLILSALALIVDGAGGLAEPTLTNPTAASQLLVILIVGSCFMGAALTVRDLVGERQIFQRERSVGLSPAAYIGAKASVYGAVAIVESTVLVLGVHAGARFATQSFISPTIDLLLAVALTTWCSAMIGLVISATVRSSEQVMPALVVFIMLQLVFCSGLIGISGRIVLDQISWLMPARWGYAAAASAVDLRGINPVAANDPLWAPEAADTSGRWERWYWWRVWALVRPTSVFARVGRRRERN